MRTKYPNIILIIMDCARALNLSCYGYHRETTPNIDKIAEEGVIYENAITSASWTLPSHGSIFTGVYSSKHNAHAKHRYLDDKYITLQEILREEGYETIGISSNMWVSENFGLSRGFLKFFNVWQLFQDVDNVKIGNAWRTADKLGDKLSNMWKALDGNSLLNKGTNFLKGGLNELYERYFFHKYDYGARRINKIAKKEISKIANDETPFYMFINYMETHGSYNPPELYRLMYLPSGIEAQKVDQIVNMNLWKYIMGGYNLDGWEFEILKALYDGELTYTDYRIAELYNFLKDTGILEDTLLTPCAGFHRAIA